jgi:hypothetical protein
MVTATIMIMPAAIVPVIATGAVPDAPAKAECEKQSKEYFHGLEMAMPQPNNNAVQNCFCIGT